MRHWHNLSLVPSQICFIWRTFKGQNRIIIRLSVRPSVLRLSVGSNNIRTEGLLSLARAMKANATLSHIYIWGNHLEEPVCQVTHTHTHTQKFSTYSCWTVTDTPSTSYIMCIILTLLLPVRPSASWWPAAVCLQSRQTSAPTMWAVRCFSLSSPTVWGDTVTGQTATVQTHPTASNTAADPTPPLLHRWRVSSLFPCSPVRLSSTSSHPPASPDWDWEPIT